MARKRLTSEVLDLKGLGHFWNLDNNARPAHVPPPEFEAFPSELRYLRLLRVKKAIRSLFCASLLGGGRVGWVRQDAYSGSILGSDFAFICVHSRFPGLFSCSPPLPFRTPLPPLPPC